jgi:hypothetical protein
MKTGEMSTYENALEKPQEGESSFASASKEAKREGTEFRKIGYLPSVGKARTMKRTPRMPKLGKSRY